MQQEDPFSPQAKNPERLVQQPVNNTDSTLVFDCFAYTQQIRMQFSYNQNCIKEKKGLYLSEY